MAPRAMLALLVGTICVGISLAAVETTITPSMDYDPSPVDRTSYMFTLTADTTATTRQYSLDGGIATTAPASLTVTVMSTGPHCLQFWTNIEGAKEVGAIYCWTIETFNKTAGCSFGVSLNAAEEVTDKTGTVKLTDFKEGPNNVVVYAYDHYGNSKSGDFSWNTDLSGPEVVFTSTSAMAHVTETTRVFAYGTPLESVSSLVAFKYSINDAPLIMTGGSTFSADFPVKDCQTTAHKVSVMAVDGVGNIGPATSYEFVVEPINTMIVLTTNTLVSGTAAVKFSATEGAGVTAAVAGYEFSLDGAPYEMTTQYKTFSGLPDGVHTVSVRAVSTSGCKDPSPVSVSFTSDSTAPVTTVAEMACPNPIINTPFASIYGSVEDAGGNIAAAGTMYKLGDTEWTVPVPCAGCPSNMFVISLANLVDGEYSISVKSTDTLGNAEEYKEVCLWTVDVGMIPLDTIVIYGPPSPMAAGSEAKFVFGEISTKPVVYFTSLNNGPWEQVAGNTLLLMDLPAGIHTLHAYAVDEAGNQDPTPCAYTWSVYGDLYDHYKAVGGFKTVDKTPLTYQSKKADVVHDALKSTCDPGYLVNYDVVDSYPTVPASTPIVASTDKK